MSGILVHGQELSAPGMFVQNFRVSGIPNLRNAARRAKRVTQVIVHETVTSSARATVDVLQQRGLGVHFIVGSDGFIYQHADLQDDECWHASEHNGPSVGIETVNPYYPKFVPKNGPWTASIPAPWADGGVYVLPTPDQAEAVTQLVSWLASPASTLAIPKAWAGLEDGKMFFSKTPLSDRGDGIYAHHYFGHMDGAWLVLYAWLRLEPGLSPQEAYQEATRRATAARGTVYVGDYFANTPVPSV